MAALPIFLDVLAEEQATLGLPVDSKPASLPVANPTKSFWIDTPGANPLAKEGSEGPLTHDTDICIIGSGITGVSAAYHISKSLAAQPSLEEPLKITILEARDFCSGATGRNGGHLTPNAFQDFARYAASYGTDEAIRQIKLEKYTASEIVKLVKAAGKESVVDLVAGGHMSLLFSDLEVTDAKADYLAAKAAGVNVDDVEFLSKEQVLETYGANYPGVRIPGHNVWPLKLVTHLYNTAKELGMNSSTSTLNLHTNTPVTAVTPIAESDSYTRRWNLTTPRGSISCSYILHATNAYASSLIPHMHGPSGIIPVRGQVVALRAAAPLENITRSGWGGNQGFEYWFPRPLESGEKTPLVILGGGRESSRPEFELYTVDDSDVHSKVGETLRKFLPAVFPGMYEEGREPEMEWSGIMGFTTSSDPFVGPVIDSTRPAAYKGQYISAGYTGHGMTRAFGCAEIVAGMIVADIQGKKFSAPEWMPRHYFTVEHISSTS